MLAWAGFRRPKTAAEASDMAARRPKMAPGSSQTDQYRFNMARQVPNTVPETPQTAPETLKMAPEGPRQPQVG